MPENVTDRKCCHKCHKTGKRKLSKCARCHSITYCSVECQREDWSRHREFCIPVMVAEIPGMGRGLVASKDFKKGQIIFTEPAVIAVNAPSGLVPLEEMLEQIRDMSEEQKFRFYQLRPTGRVLQAQAADAVRFNCLQELDIFHNYSKGSNANDRRLLFLSSELMNHSCASNATLGRPFSQEPDKEVNVRAIKDIKKGEEITHCYMKGMMTKSEMKTKLQTLFGFDCKCPVCSGGVPNQDGIISEINRLVELPSPSGFVNPVSFLDPSSTLSLYSRRKQSDWRAEALKHERAADLTKELYIGHVQDKFSVLTRFATTAQLARDSRLLKKALDLGKEWTESLGLETLCEAYKALEKGVRDWSSEFKSKENPVMYEIWCFYSA